MEGAFSPGVYFPHLFFRGGGIWLVCFVLFITHMLLLKKSHVCACCEANMLFYFTSFTQARTHVPTEQYGGTDVFSGALYGLRRWKHIIKVTSRSGVYWKEFLPSVNSWLKELHIKQNSVFKVAAQPATTSVHHTWCVTICAIIFAGVWLARYPDLEIDFSYQYY